MSNYYYSDAGIPKSSPAFLQWVKGMGSVNRAQQTASMQHHSYNPENTYNRILVDVVIVQRVVEYELTSYKKQRTVNNLVMGALLSTDDIPVLEEMARVYPDLEQTEYSRDGFTSKTKKFEVTKVPTNPYERREWLDIVNDKFPERLTLREYGYFERNGEVIAENLIAKMPDSVDIYHSVKNTHLPGEYGSIHVYRDDFRPVYTYEEINQQQQEASNFIERVRLEQKFQFEEKKREKERIEKQEREEANRKTWEEIKKNLKGPRHVVEYDDVLY